MAPPTRPTITFTDTADGTGGTLTVSGSDALTTNTPYYSDDGVTFIAIGVPCVGDDDIAIALTVGTYYFFVYSDNGEINVSNILMASVTDNTVTASTGLPGEGLINRFGSSYSIQHYDETLKAWTTDSTKTVWIQPASSKDIIVHERRGIHVDHKGYLSSDPEANEGYRLYSATRVFNIVGIKNVLEMGKLFQIFLEEKI